MLENEKIQLERKQKERKLYIEEMKKRKEGEKYLFLFENDIDIHNEWFKEGIYLYGEELVLEIISLLVSEKNFKLKSIVIGEKEHCFKYDKIIVSEYLLEGTYEEVKKEEVEDKEEDKEEDEEEFYFKLKYNVAIQNQINDLLNNNQILKINLEIK